jgi:hypothetical protein
MIQKDILLIFLTMTLIYTLAISNSAAAYKLAMLPILIANIPEAHEVSIGTNHKIDRIILSKNVKFVTNEASKLKNQNSIKKRMVMRAKKDLAHRLSVESDQINLLEVRPVTWPDASLGCPQPGKVYTELPQDGLLIRLEVAGRMYFYHSGENVDPFLCEQTSQLVPHPKKGDEFVPPPGSEID